jgi:hypothetical protein
MAKQSTKQASGKGSKGGAIKLSEEELGKAQGGLAKKHGEKLPEK